MELDLPGVFQPISNKGSVCKKNKDIGPEKKEPVCKRFCIHPYEVALKCLTNP